MKATTIIRQILGLLVVAVLTAGPALFPQAAQAQGNVYPDTAYSREELAQMLAPIALYPDVLLSQILMASTYPIEVIEADRWVMSNPHLQGEALDVALAAEDWDPSVKALCHFPSILALMSDRIGETTNLGNAFLAQEGEVMAMVQELRAAAYAQGNLTTTSRQQVIVERETIIIEPPNPRVIYVPYYDPFYIYGPWWYPTYPPYYWAPPGVSIGFSIAYWPGVYFSFSFGSWSYFDWHHHYIYIDVHKRPRYVRHDRWIAKPGRWQHAPRHRRGVAYRDKPTALKFGQAPRVTRFRRDTRGFPERQVTDRNRRGDIPSLTDRQRVERRRTVPADQTRQRIDRSRQQPTRVKPVRQTRQRIELERQKREQAIRDVRERQRIDRERQVRERAERGRPQRVRIERERSVRQPVVNAPPRRQGDSRSAPLQRIERRQPPRAPESAFKRVEEGRKERRAGERGRLSRQGRDGGFRSSGGAGGDGRSGRNDRDRTRR
jgi:hypothetical protein